MGTGAAHPVRVRHTIHGTAIVDTRKDVALFAQVASSVGNLAVITHMLKFIHKGHTDNDRQTDRQTDTWTYGHIVTSTHTIIDT